MTDKDVDGTLEASADLPPMSSEEAAEVVRNDEALKAAGSDSTEDAATDDEARESST
jgi:hypothetical protein